MAKEGQFSFRTRYQSMLDAMLGIFYPPICQWCSKYGALADHGFICNECLQSPGFFQLIGADCCARCGLPFEGELSSPFECSNCRGLSLGFEWAKSVYVATPDVLKLIGRYKYGGEIWFERLIASRFAQVAGESLVATDWDGIVPVPLYSVRKRERGFNQAEQLAMVLGEKVGVKVMTNILKRTTPTQTQTRFGRKSRMKNVAHAFEVTSGVSVLGQKLVLVDDVLTTGATTSSCAFVLKRAGAAKIVVWTFARGR